MKYRLNQTNYHTFGIYEDHKLKPRSYFIPYPDRTSADAVSLRDRRYSSSRVKCLNGEWDFKFYPLPDRVPDEFDTDSESFDRIEVPSCWQFRGYDHPFYVNTRYQFPFDPPVIPKTEEVGPVFAWCGADIGLKPVSRRPQGQYNFVGIYRTFFKKEDPDRTYILSFMGVASCADVYVNGSYVGYSEGSHNTAEFDVTSFAHAGDNELLVVVHRWCSGSYLECQDMFRNNGIFRDVLLYVNDPVDIRDLDLKMEKTAQGYNACVRAELSGESDGREVTFSLEGSGISEKIKTQAEGGLAEVLFENLPVREWNAEEPVLYHLYCELPGTCVKTEVGFRTVTIDGRVFKINGRPVKLHGVNHHDTSPVNGYSMTREEIERDIRLCREYNIDTVRTSHYPPDPYLLELCDKEGIYVIDEADLEAHGGFTMQLPSLWNRISDDPKWADRYTDRVSRLCERDKLHVSIIMWSLGNEAGGGCNTDREYDYLKSRTDIPVHYENVIHSKRQAYDVGSQMYPTAEEVRLAGEGRSHFPRLNDRPYFLCEYAHAMGVGPGNAESYWQEIYSHESLMGGCVWEMNDHAVLHEDGSYSYGGDHGEWEHDGNFCVDGLFYPDRSPSTGAKIIKFLYRPIRARRIEGAAFELFNTTGFTSGDRFLLKCEWSDGGSAEIIPSCGPLEKEITELIPDTLAPEGYQAPEGDAYLTICTIDRRDGRTLSEEQILLESRPKSAPPFIFRDMTDQLRIHKNGVSVRVGREIMRSAVPYTTLFRAATDNDTDLLMRNPVREFYDEKESILSVRKEEGLTRVVSEIRTEHFIFHCLDVYEETAEGILVTSVLHTRKGRGNIPRFSKVFRLPVSFDRVEYRGRRGESYCDMKEQFPVETVTCSVSDMTEPNIRPQESGNRSDTCYALLSDGKQSVRFTAVGGNFELGIKRYSDSELLGMRHRSDEVTTGTYVSIGAFQMGIGTGSCGPTTAKEYLYPSGRDYTLKFLISTAGR